MLESVSLLLLAKPILLFLEFPSSFGISLVLLTLSVSSVFIALVTDSVGIFFSLAISIVLLFLETVLLILKTFSLGILILLFLLLSKALFFCFFGGKAIGFVHLEELLLAFGFVTGVLSILDFFLQACLLGVLSVLALLISLFFFQTVSFSILITFVLKSKLSGFVFFALLSLFFEGLLFGELISLLLLLLVCGFFIKEGLASSVVLHETFLFNPRFLLVLFLLISFTLEAFLVLTIFSFFLFQKFSLLLFLLKNLFLILFFLSSSHLELHLFFVLLLLFNDGQALGLSFLLTLIS